MNGRHNLRIHISNNFLRFDFFKNIEFVAETQHGGKKLPLGEDIALVAASRVSKVPNDCWVGNRGIQSWAPMGD